MSHNFKVSRRAFLSAAGIAALMPASLNAAPKGYGIVGQQAPELEVATWIDGKGQPSNFSLSDQHGKFVMLECWQAWCPGCHRHGFPALQKIFRAFQDHAHFVPVGIQTTFEGYSVNTQDKLMQMQTRYALPIMMGHDAGDESNNLHPSTMRNYRTGGTPWAILISPTGEVLYNDFSIDPDAAIKYLNEQLAKLS